MVFILLINNVINGKIEREKYIGCPRFKHAVLMLDGNPDIGAQSNLLFDLLKAFD